jgi:hypothetical protein
VHGASAIVRQHLAGPSPEIAELSALKPHRSDHSGRDIAAPCSYARPVSNQGWSQLPRKNKTPGEKVFNVVTWPFRKVFGVVTDRLLMKYGKKK